MDFEKTETRGTSCINGRFSREDHEGYRNFVRMNPDDFTGLLMCVSPLILKKDTTMREAIFLAVHLMTLVHQFSFPPPFFLLLVLFTVAWNLNITLI